MNHNPHLVSVIIPVYNADEFIAAAITSIRHQNYHPIEIIVIDDGSTDRTAAIVNSLGNDIIYRHQKNTGVAAARNYGLQLAKGEFISFLDADDFWSKGKIATQITYLNSDPALSVVFGKVQHLLLISQSPTGKLIERKFAEPAISVHLGAGLYRKSVFDCIGGFNPDLCQSEDVDLWLRIKESGLKTLTIDRTVYYYRLHAGNSIKDKNQRNKYFIQVLKHSLDRQKKSRLPELSKAGFT